MGFWGDIVSIGTLGAVGDDGWLYDTDVEGPKVPGLSAQGQQTQALQARTLTKTEELLSQLLPQQLAALGLTREDNKIRAMTQQEVYAQMTPEERLSQENIQLMQQRLGAALRGEIPVSPGLEADIERERGILQESIARRGQMGGTAEAQRMGAFTQASLVARDEARNQAMNLASQLSTQQRGLQSNLVGQRIAQLSGLGTQALPLVSAGTSALGSHLQQQQLQYDSNLRQLEAEAAQRAAAGQLVGTIGGVALGGLTGGLGAAAGGMLGFGAQPTTSYATRMTPAQRGY